MYVSYIEIWDATSRLAGIACYSIVCKLNARLLIPPEIELAREHTCNYVIQRTIRTLGRLSFLWCCMIRSTHPSETTIVVICETRLIQVRQLMQAFWKKKKHCIPLQSNATHCTTSHWLALHCICIVSHCMHCIVFASLLIACIAYCTNAV